MNLTQLQWRRRRRTAFAALAVTWLTMTAATAEDWPAWRGPSQNGAAACAAPATRFKPDGDNVLWHNDWGGRNTPIVWDGRVFFSCPADVDTPKTRERVVCLDADTGELIWEHRFNVFLTDIVENRVGWSAVAVDSETGNVYCHGTGGELFCWNRDGKELWKVSLTEQLGRISGYGGRLMTPLIDEDRVVISFLSSNWGSHARGLHRYYAFDKDSGEVVWISETTAAPLDTTYATPAVGVIAGKRMLVAPAADGCVYGMLARTGQIVWKCQLSKRGLNTSAIINGDRAYVTHSEENYTTTRMGAVVCLDATRNGDVTEDGVIWRIDGVTAGYCSPALANGRLYVITNDADLIAYRADSGEEIWRQNIGRVGKGSPVVTRDGVIYVGEQNGVFQILKDVDDHCETLFRHTFQRDDDLVDEMFGSPAVCNGRVYFMTRYNTFCLGSAEPVASESTNALQPEEVVNSPKTAHLQITPAEITVHAGDTVSYGVKAFNADGQQALIMTREMPTWGTNGIPGEWNAEGNFTVGPVDGYAIGSILVRWQGVEATARIRVIPKLPIQLTFDDMAVSALKPIWPFSGLRLRVADLDGQHALEKVADKKRPSPPFMRLRTYISDPLPTGYTIQADMMSGVRETRRFNYQPDMGLINARYRLTLQGANSKAEEKTFLRIESWGPVPRLQEDMDFGWEPGTWYTVKFEVELLNDSEQAICRGKVWPRDAAEPDAWTMEVIDPCPNLEGSPGLYAYSTGTIATKDGPPTFFDNVRVYRED